MKKTATAGLLALAAGALPFAGAAADDTQRAVPVTTASATSQISFTANADDAATEWNESNPDAIAVAVYLGTETDLTPQQLTTGISNIAASEGVGNVQFFFEQNDTPANSFALYYRDVYDAPIAMDDIVTKTREAAGYLKTDREIFQTASADYDTLN